MKTSIIILTYNKLDYTRQCIESIRQFTRPDSYEIIVVDNHSTDATVEWLRQQEDIQTIFNDENKGFPAGCNQGIEVVSGDDILLLNNDTVVTQSWLDNLSTCLHSSDNIGAVGPVTNYAFYNQAISVNYKTIDEMHRFAGNFNTSDSTRWEQRIKLIGFCLLIRKSVIDQTGLLDERFTPGHYEDDDYSVRMRRAGYRLMLCQDTFIHHYGSISFKDDKKKHIELGKNNAAIFEKKWGFNPDYSSYIRTEIIDCIDLPVEKPINVLEVGCGCGATLLKIKNNYKNARLYGIELNENSAIDAKLIAEVKSVNIEKEPLDYPPEYFDYIIFADVLEHLYDPWKLLSDMKAHLAPAGQILASIPNTMHYTVIRDLLNGNWTYQDAGLLDWTHIRFFTAHEITKMFTGAGYPFVAFKALPHLEKHEDLEFIKKLGELTNEKMVAQYKINQYIVKASKTGF